MIEANTPARSIVPSLEYLLKLSAFLVLVEVLVNLEQRRRAATHSVHKPFGLKYKMVVPIVPFVVSNGDR